MSQTPLVESEGAAVSQSGFTGICLLCNISDVDHLVTDNLTDETSINLTAGVASGGFACVELDRTIPAGRLAGFVANLNGGLAGLLANSTVSTLLDGQPQESLSGSGSLITLAGIGDNNATGAFSEPFNEICYEGVALLDVLASYDLSYAFVMEGSAATSTLDAQPAAITANGTARTTVTLTVNDDLGDPLPGGGDSLRFFTTVGSLSETVIDHGDGSYSTMLTASNNIETATVSAELNGELVSDTATVDFVADSGGPADAATTQIDAVPNAIVADGTDTSLIVVQARDAWGNALTSGGDTVILSTSTGSLGPVSDLGDGFYTAPLTSNTIGEAVVSGTINGAPIDDTTSVRFENSVEADASESSIQADPDELPADGISVSTIVVQAADGSGTPLDQGGDDVQVFTTLGTLAATVTDNGDGSYSTTLTAPDQAGTAEVSGTINGEPISMTAEIVFSSDVADPSTSTISARPSAITANGSAQATIIVEARDGGDTPIGNGGDSVQLFTTAGVLSTTVVDHGDGTYSTALTASNTEEVAEVSGRINGQPMADTATVAFVADSGGPADGETSGISASPSAIVADGADTAVITVEARDAWGNPLASGGDTVVLTSTGGNLSTVTDQGDGSYITELTANSVGQATITGTINGEPIVDDASVRFESAIAADAGQSSASSNPDLLPADGISMSVITVQAADSSGTPLTVGGDEVEIFTTLGTLAATVTDNDDGTYTTVLTAPLEAGIADVSATINGEPIGFNAQVEFYDPNTADAGNTTIVAVPGSITANGSAQAVITVEARNAADEPVSTGGDAVTLSTTAGSISTSITDHGNGSYTAMLTASTNEETATITGTINSELISDAAGVDFVADTGGPADPATTTVSASPDTIAADGSSTSTVTVQARDAWGNALDSGGDEVAIATTSGSLSGITDEGDGSYTATLTASSEPGEAVLTATLNGQPVADSATVILAATAPEIDPEQSYIAVNPDNLPPDGLSTANVTVHAVDGSGNPITVGGDAVALTASAGTLATTVTDNGDGTYTTTFTAPNESGEVVISGTINGVPIGGNATIVIGTDGIFADRFEDDG